MNKSRAESKRDFNPDPTTVTKKNSTYYVTRFYNALRELDVMKEAYMASRIRHITIVERYKNSTGAMYLKAQKAAVEADEDAVRLSEIGKRKRAIIKSFAKVWNIYSHDTETGEVIVEYIRNHGDARKLRWKFTQDLIDRALGQWWEYCDSMAILAENRRQEQEDIMNRRKHKYARYWWDRKDEGEGK